MERECGKLITERGGTWDLANELVRDRKEWRKFAAKEYLGRKPRHLKVYEE